MAAQLEGEWPYVREHPELVRLDPRPDVTPSSKPPVRIFLGTEEGQYRAERVFVWSVLQARDPARTYEIHLMKNLAGFDRRGWRTGFTCYRFAIPDLAGREGKAIYNDVDQIYLADPALLFDLDLGGRGYLAIDARDTSVMLIDCARMLPWWNRQAAARRGAKGPLTSGPAKQAGLWGGLDPHWNARDQEFVEGRTRCLHFTLLHQQPWQPFPDDYSYHENPLAYLWHALEGAADAAGFTVFRNDAPSPGFLPVLGRNLPPAESAADQGPLVSQAAGSLLAVSGAERLLVTALGAANAAAVGTDLPVTRHDFAARRGALPEERSDAVLAAGILERVPGSDADWILRDLFASTRRCLVLRIATTAEAGLGSADWWRRRVELVARQHPGVSWQLDAVARLPTGRLRTQSHQVRKVAPPAEPLIWVFTGSSRQSDREALNLAHAVGGRVVERTAGAPTAAAPPWPDLAILSGRGGLAAAREARSRSGGRTRLVQLGRPNAAFPQVDLIVARPDERLPTRDNVLQTAAPLLPVANGAATERPAVAAGPLAGLRRPITALLLAGDTGAYVLDEAAATALGHAARAAAGGDLVVLGDGAVQPKLLAALRAAVGQSAPFIDAAREDEAERRLVLDAADRFVLLAGDVAALAEVIPTGRQVALFGLKHWTEELPLVRPLARLVLPILGGSTYRGTPLQQHLPGRFLDWLTSRGLITRGRDPEALYRALEGRGLLVRLGAEPRIATRRPPDDLRRAAAAVHRLLGESSTSRAA